MKSRFGRVAIILALSCAALSVGCATGAIKTLSDLNAISYHLKQKYHDEVAVNLNNSRFLTVVFINSPLNKMAGSERLSRAQDAAVFVSRNYEGIKSVEQIWISFVATETYFVVFHKTEGLGSFGFDKDGKGIGPGSENEEDNRAPVVRFNQARNESDVSVTRVQLEGTPNNGVALVPHFTVTGDARVRSTAAPEMVTLDFASYSPQPRFTYNPQLEIYCDDKLIVKGPAQLMPAEASGAEETIAQFVTVRVSFKSFQRMAQARKVRINLGPKHFELGAGDIEALAGMAAHAGASATSNNGD
jgi:hypothetical protein